MSWADSVLIQYTLHPGLLSILSHRDQGLRTQTWARRALHFRGPKSSLIQSHTSPQGEESAGPGDSPSLGPHCSPVRHTLGSRFLEFFTQTTPILYPGWACFPEGDGGQAPMYHPKSEGWQMGGYLKGVWMELGHMVCGVHAQACDISCGTYRWSQESWVAALMGQFSCAEI